MLSGLTDWKTTVPAVIAAFFAFVLAYPQHFQALPILIDVAGFGVAGGLVVFGISAKQADKGSDLPSEVVDAKIAHLPPVVPPPK